LPHRFSCYSFTSYWFGVVVTAFVASTKLSYVEPGLYWDWCRPLAGLPSRCFPGHSGQLSLAIPPWIVAMSTGQGRDGEFCVVLDPAPGLMAYGLSRLKALAVNLSWPSSQLWFYASLNGSNLRRLKAPYRGWAPRYGLHCLYVIFFCSY